MKVLLKVLLIHLPDCDVIRTYYTQACTEYTRLFTFCDLRVSAISDILN